MTIKKNKIINYYNILILVLLSLGLNYSIFIKKEFSSSLLMLSSITKLIPKGAYLANGLSPYPLCGLLMQATGFNYLELLVLAPSSVSRRLALAPCSTSTSASASSTMAKKETAVLSFRQSQSSRAAKAAAPAALKSGSQKILSYNFNTNTTYAATVNAAALAANNGVLLQPSWYLPENLNKLISAFFKSIYCLISKPKFINTPDKIIIEILYYITIPDHNIFKWYNFIYNPKNYSPQATLPLLGESKEINNCPVRATKATSAPALADKQAAAKAGTNTSVSSIAVKQIKKVRRKKSIKTIYFKNFLLKKTLFNLNNSNIASIYLNKFIILFKLLSSYFNKPIEFNLIRLHKSDYDSNILAQLFVLILKKKNIRIAINKLYNKNNIENFNTSGSSNATKISNCDSLADSKYIPAVISGLYIHIGGRLMREPIIPRLTTKKFERGAIATGKVNFLDSARITKKNKKGAYTIKIAYAQNLVAANIN
jgi:hypothetical protein